MHLSVVNFFQSFNDDQRRRLAAKGKPTGEQASLAWSP
jgi:hypothetical protein